MRNNACRGGPGRHPDHLQQLRRSRPVSCRNDFVNGSTPLRNTYHYDKLGRLVARRYAADENILTDTLRYDIRGWLTEQRNDRFATSLHYYDPQQTATIPSYTGNITEWTFRHTGESCHTYAFAYDALSRLTETKQYIDGTANDRFVEKGLTYDRNGNILTLQRQPAGQCPTTFPILIGQPTFRAGRNRIRNLRLRCQRKYDSRRG